MQNILLCLLLFWQIACNHPQEKPAAPVVVAAVQDTIPAFKIKSLNHAIFITGSVRNGIRAMEGVDFRINKLDTNALDFRFSMVNWRDKFPELKGAVRLDSSSFLTDTFRIKNDRDSLVPAFRLSSVNPKQKVWIALTKDGQHARVFQLKAGKVQELNYSLLWAK